MNSTPYFNKERIDNSSTETKSRSGFPYVDYVLFTGSGHAITSTDDTYSMCLCTYVAMWFPFLYIGHRQILAN